MNNVQKLSCWTISVEWNQIFRSLSRVHFEKTNQHFSLKSSFNPPKPRNKKGHQNDPAHYNDVFDLLDAHTNLQFHKRRVSRFIVRIFFIFHLFVYIIILKWSCIMGCYYWTFQNTLFFFKILFFVSKYLITFQKCFNFFN